MDLGEVGQCSDGVFLATLNFGKLWGGRSTSNPNRCSTSVTPPFFCLIFTAHLVRC